MASALHIALLPYGGVDPDLLEGLKGPLRLIFPFPVEVLDAEETPEFAFQANRGQYLSKAILDDLVERAPVGCVRILGLTEVDLFIPILTFVYGEAMLPGRAAVVSTHRLSASGQGTAVDFDVLRDRVVTEAVHELGHTFNLTHCDDPDCAMSFSHGLEQVDTKRAAFCRYCKVLLTDALRLPL